MSLPTFYPEQKQIVEETLEQIFNKIENSCENNLHKAMRYSTLNGGKRIRGILVLEAALLNQNELPAVAPKLAACIELLHSFSLVHDDLPAMDDDSMRRGNEACHIRYGENVAILAGNALMNKAFDLIGSLSEATIQPARKNRFLNRLTARVGERGLIGGQYADVTMSLNDLDEFKLKKMYKHKTGSLIALSLELGSISADLDEPIVQKLGQIGEQLGIVFQIKDDLLEITETSKNLGKDARSDADNEKITYPSLVGVKNARKEARSLNQSIGQTLRSIQHDTENIETLMNFILERNR